MRLKYWPVSRKETLVALNRKLSLSYTGTEQGWDIEMADCNRINEFIDFYHQYDLAFEEELLYVSNYCIL